MAISGRLCGAPELSEVYFPHNQVFTGRSFPLPPRSRQVLYPKRTGRSGERFASTSTSGQRIPTQSLFQNGGCLIVTVFFPLKCSRNFVMVFLDPFSMSSPKPRQGPSPPSVEQILEDLSAAKDDDVVFKSPMQLGEHVSVYATRDQTKGKTNISVSHLDKTENAVEHSTGGRDMSEDKGSADEGKPKSQSNEQLYGIVASFLEQFKSLESSQEQLNSLEGDLKAKEEDLEEAISKVKDAWKVDKNDS